MSLHAIGGLATVLIWAVWLSTSYVSASRSMAVAFVAAFVAFYLLAPAIAGRFGRPLTGPARQAAYAGPASLFVFAVIAYSYPATRHSGRCLPRCSVSSCCVPGAPWHWSRAGSSSRHRSSPSQPKRSGPRRT